MSPALHLDAKEQVSGSHGGRGGGGLPRGLLGNPAVEGNSPARPGSCRVQSGYAGAVQRDCCHLDSLASHALSFKGVS